MTGLVKKIDAFVKENKKADAQAFVVYLGKDGDEAKAKLQKLAKAEKLEIPLTINLDPSTRKAFKLNEKVKNTVLVYRKKKVTANFALNEVGEKEIDSVLKAAKEAASS